MKDKKIIAYKSDRVKKIAYNLRGLIRDVTMREWGRLGREQKKIPLGKIKVTSLNDRLVLERTKYRDIEDERSDLYRALGNSLCICSGCHQTDRDMYYNAAAEGWYCTLCVQEYRDFYHKKKAILDQGGFVGDFDEYFHKTFL